MNFVIIVWIYCKSAKDNWDDILSGWYNRSNLWHCIATILFWQQLINKDYFILLCRTVFLQHKTEHKYDQKGSWNGGVALCSNSTRHYFADQLNGKWTYCHYSPCTPLSHCYPQFTLILLSFSNIKWRIMTSADCPSFDNFLLDIIVWVQRQNSGHEFCI